MIPFYVDYASPSVFDAGRDRALLGLTADGRRKCRFHGRIREHILEIRLALATLGEAIWSAGSGSWQDAHDQDLLDPCVTVHSDRVLIEGFSLDQSVYACVTLAPSLFDIEGDIICGTTTVDFTAWLWGALQGLRSNRETWLRIDPQGFQLQTHGAGGRFEQRVELEDSWVRAYLELQAAMAMPGTRIRVRPVDLLAVLRFLRNHRREYSPRALRYEFPPGERPHVVLEPWEEIIPLHDAEHGYTELRTVRTWGRRRLKLIEPLLPYADDATVYLKGRAQPSFYSVTVAPGIEFVLGLSGWSRSRWSDSSFGLGMGLSAPPPEELLERCRALLQERVAMRDRELAETLGVDVETTARALQRLCLLGEITYDLARREYRHRRLFDNPPPIEVIDPPNPRKEGARRLLECGEIEVTECTLRETKKPKFLRTGPGGERRKVTYRDWVVEGERRNKGNAWPVEVVLNDRGRIIFGTCKCDFFTENLLHLGPCECLLALAHAGEARRRDGASSDAIDAEEDDT